MSRKNDIWDHVILRTPSWETLDTMINNKWTKSSLIWLAITPLAAKAFSGVEEIYFSFLSGNIDLVLPFSWVHFFFAALFFSLASVVFSVFCPRVIKNYKNLSDFNDKDASKSQLTHLVIDLIPKGSVSNDFKDEFRRLMNKWGEIVGAEPTEEEDGEHYYSLRSIMSQGIGEAFIGLRMVSNDMHHAIRLTIAVFFIFGCLFLSRVVIQNIIFVLQQL